MPARELPWQIAPTRFGLGDAHEAQEFERTSSRSGSIEPSRRSADFFELRADARERVECRQRVLHHEPSPPIHRDGAARLHHAARQEPERGPQRQAFARARFTNDANGLTGLHLERDAVHQLGAASDEGEVGHREHAHHFTRQMSERPSPVSDNPIPQ